MRTLATAFATCLLIAPTAVSGTLFFAPNSVYFNVQVGGVAPPPINVFVTFNGFPATITGVSATTTTGQNWLLPAVSGVLATLTVGTNAVDLSPGAYTGTVFATTTVGSDSFQANLNVGEGTPPGIPEPPSLILTLTGSTGAGLYQARRIFARARHA